MKDLVLEEGGEHGLGLDKVSSFDLTRCVAGGVGRVVIIFFWQCDGYTTQIYVFGTLILNLTMKC